MHFWTRSAQKWVILDGLTHETQPEDLAARVTAVPRYSATTTTDAAYKAALRPITQTETVFLRFVVIVNLYSWFQWCGTGD